jgi:hypothetical protein
MVDAEELLQNWHATIREHTKAEPVAPIHVETRNERFKREDDELERARAKRTDAEQDRSLRKLQELLEQYVENKIQFERKRNFDIMSLALGELIARINRQEIEIKKLRAELTDDKSSNVVGITRKSAG